MTHSTRALLAVTLAMLIFSTGAGPSSAKTTAATSAKLCTKSPGYAALTGERGERFRTAGACTSYAARGGTLTPSAEGLCRSLGGAATFTGEDATLHFSCDAVPYAVTPDAEVKVRSGLFARCAALGGIGDGFGNPDALAARWRCIKRGTPVGGFWRTCASYGGEISTFSEGGGDDGVRCDFTGPDVDEGLQNACFGRAWNPREVVTGLPGEPSRVKCFVREGPGL